MYLHSGDSGTDKPLWELPQAQESLELGWKLQILHLETCPDPETNDTHRVAFENLEILDNRIKSFSALAA